MAADGDKIYDEHWSDEMRSAGTRLKGMLNKRKRAINDADCNKKKRRRRDVRMPDHSRYLSALSADILDPLNWNSQIGSLCALVNHVGPF
jgi:hypothetical protein